MPADSIASDEDLMERYRAGDAGAFDLLYARHKGGVYRYMLDRKSTRLNSSHIPLSRMPSSA